LGFSLFFTEGHCKCSASLVGPVHVLSAVMFYVTFFMSEWW